MRLHHQNPALLTGSLVILATGTGWLFSIIGRSPSMAISAGIAAAFLVPWTVYLLSLFFTMAPDDVRVASTITQWTVGFNISKVDRLHRLVPGR